jgi:hypothetical protein
MNVAADRIIQLGGPRIEDPCCTLRWGGGGSECSFGSVIIVYQSYVILQQKYEYINIQNKPYYFLHNVTAKTFITGLVKVEQNFFCMDYLATK